MLATAWPVIPANWTRQHHHLLARFRNDTELELLEKLIKHRALETNPGQLPPDMVEKSIEVIEFLLTNRFNISDIDTAIDQARQNGALP